MDTINASLQRHSQKKNETRLVFRGSILKRRGTVNSLMQAFLLYSLLQGAASADEIRKITFVTEPSGVQVFHGDLNNLLGRSGKAIPVAVKDSGYQTFLFSHPGYEIARQEYLVHDIKNHVPSQGAVHLVPMNKRVALRAWVGRNAIFLSMLLLVGGVTGGLAVSRLRKTSIAKEAAEERERRLSAYKGNDDDSLIQRVLGQWRLVEEAGRGGMSVVYKALPDDDLDPSKMVAVKVLSEKAMEDQEFLARFRREVLVCRSLNHRNIVQLHDWGEQDGKTFLVLEWLEGETLRDKIKKARLPLKELAEYLEPLFDALSYAHSKGIAHRDIKPGNIMLTKRGLLKVVDFGLARAENTETITVTGDALGTPAYMAPEQIRGETLSPSTDQYSLGILTYELLTGHLPFDDKEALQQIFAHLTKEPIPMTERDSSLSPKLDEVVLRMLAKEPEERYDDLKCAWQSLQMSLRDQT